MNYCQFCDATVAHLLTQCAHEQRERQHWASPMSFCILKIKLCPNSPISIFAFIFWSRWSISNFRMTLNAQISIRISDSWFSCFIVFGWRIVDSRMHKQRYRHDFADDRVETIKSKKKRSDENGGEKARCNKNAIENRSATSTPTALAEFISNFFGSFGWFRVKSCAACDRRFTEA